MAPRRAFLGVKGFSLEEGCTDANLLEVQLKGLMVQRANELFVLADHSKLGNIALSAFAALKQVHTLITDEGADLRLVESLRGQGMRVILAPLG